jgi:hypothetical protein
VASAFGGRPLRVWDTEEGRLLATFAFDVGLGGLSR